MALYDELKSSLHGSGNQFGFSSTGRNFQSRIDDAKRKAQREGRPITGYQPLSYRYGRGNRYSSTVQVPIFGQTEAERLAPIQAEQRRLAGIQQASYEKQQADIAKQLKIVQEEKSAVSKAQQDYTNMLIAEAQRKKEAEEQAARDLQTQRANQAMAGMSGNLQIQQAGNAPRTGGTQQFRRRALQQGTASPYKGLSAIQSGMVNV